MRGIIIFVSLLGLSCAKPNYVDASPKILKIAKRNACAYQFSNLDVCATINWEVIPSSTQLGSLIVVFSKNSSWPIISTQPTEIFARTWMPGMGHGAGPIVAIIEKLSTGVFRISNLAFTMNGAWQVQFDALETDPSTGKSVKVDSFSVDLKI